MAGQKTFIFDPQDLYALLCHYTDGAIPLNGTIRGIGVNPYLSRVVGMQVASEEWRTQEPFHIRYDGRRTATWVKGMDKAEWAEREETPRRQM